MAATAKYLYDKLHPRSCLATIFTTTRGNPMLRSIHSALFSTGSSGGESDELNGLDELSQHLLERDADDTAIIGGVDLEAIEELSTVEGRRIKPGDLCRVLFLDRWGDLMVHFDEPKEQEQVRFYDIRKLRRVKRSLPLKYGPAVVPTSAYNQAAFDYCGYFNASNGIYLAGPAVLWGWKATKATLVIFVAVPAVAWAATPCHSLCTGFAQIPDAVYALPGLGIAYLVWVEGRVRQYSVIWQTLCCGETEGFSFLGTRLSFEVWLLVNISFSVAAHADIVTTGMFLAKTVVTDACSPCVADLWRYTMQHSVLGAYIGELSFSAIVAASWLLILLQFAYAAALALPWKGAIRLHTTGKPVSALNHQLARQDNQDELLTEFDSVLGSSLHNGSAIDVLADVGRMATVTNQRASYLLARYHREPISVSNGMEGLLWQALMKFVTFLLLETGISLNLQAVGLALAKAASEARVLDWQIVLSLLAGFIMAAKNFAADVSLVMKYREMVDEFDTSAYKHYLKRRNIGCPDGLQTFEEIKDWLDTNEAEEQQRGQPTSAAMLKLGVQKIMRARTIRSRLMPMFFFVWTLYIILVLRALFQTVMAAVCSDGLYNLGVGCVDIPATLTSSYGAPDQGAV